FFLWLFAKVKNNMTWDKELLWNRHSRNERNLSFIVWFPKLIGSWVATLIVCTILFSIFSSGGGAGAGYSFILILIINVLLHIPALIGIWLIDIREFFYQFVFIISVLAFTIINLNHIQVATPLKLVSLIPILGHPLIIAHLLFFFF